MKIHLKKCAAAHGQSGSGSHLTSSSMALLGAVAVAAASANTPDDQQPSSQQQQHPPPPAGPHHRSGSPPPPPHMHSSHLRITPPTSGGQLQHHTSPHHTSPHPPPHHRVPHSPISPVGRLASHPHTTLPPIVTSSMGAPPQSLAALHSAPHGAHSAS